ncbi:LysR substrate-binding domain-containing protein [Ramlibacter sp. XY19]|uniref:LysR substrate-binding domain-containing protein n=1 Tax=Ramlibacter paludis TaxID=2908000 RepID=UPI0023DB6D5D|nr:LysR substrate-binding domain-containing protein [Ramlibacter paludis]MCG2593635.1 LysR substrate-binding domain-containing protein [Ramlibacter paludis]
MIRMQDRNAKSEPAADLTRSRQLRLDLLHSFEAAARHLSFTRAGAELFLSQSAISRQIQQLEESVGVPLFERRHRALALTEAGRIMQRAVQDSLERLRDAAARVRASTAVGHHVAVTCTPGFASFWLIPRLARFTAAHPEVDVRISATLDLVDLDRSSIDLAVRFVPVAQGSGPVLFEEQVQPMCSPLLLRDPGRPLRAPADLAQHTLLTVEMKDEPMADWEPWLQLMGVREVHMAHTMRFTQYSEAVAAAVAGHGIVIGRLPLLADLVRQKKLVAPFRSPAASRRGYFVTLAAHAAHNPDAHAFAGWLLAEAEQATRRT